MGRGGGEGRVPSLRSATAESKASTSYSFSFIFDAPSVGYWYKRERNEVYITLKVSPWLISPAGGGGKYHLGYFIGRRRTESADFGELMITSSRFCFQLPTLPHNINTARHSKFLAKKHWHSSNKHCPRAGRTNLETTLRAKPRAASG